MQTYCLSCQKHAKNIGSQKVIMTNKVIRKECWKVKIKKL